MRETAITDIVERLRRLAPMTAITAHRVIVDRVADAIAEEVADLEEVVGGNAGWERAAARAAIAELQALGLLDLPENGRTDAGGDDR